MFHLTLSNYKNCSIGTSSQIPSTSPIPSTSGVSKRKRHLSLPSTLAEPPQKSRKRTVSLQVNDVNFDEEELEIFQNFLGYQFKNLNLLKIALTHPSFNSQSKIENERLEFIGDKILGNLIQFLKNTGSWISPSYNDFRTAGC